MPALGFGEDTDKCLVSLVESEDSNLSPECSMAVKNAKDINEQLNEEIMMEQAAGMFLALSVMLSMFMVTLGICMCACGGHSGIRAERTLRRNIIHAVYDHPDIKKLVEDKIGSIGDEKPICQRQKEGKLSCCQFIGRLLLAFLFVNLCFAFPPLAFFFVIFMFVRLCRIVCCERRRVVEVNEYAAVEGYPGATDMDIELKKGAVAYVGVPANNV